MNATLEKNLIASTLPEIPLRIPLLRDALANAGAFITSAARKPGQDERTAYDRSLEMLAQFLELRDAEASGHSARVTQLTVQFAHWLELAPRQIEHLHRGALMHDLGKLGIPDEILLKKGPLSKEEWLVIRQHPVTVYEMLSSIDFFKEALEVAYNHHERWDGTGYPRRLKGDEIPLGARIFAVVDVWDALVNARVYKDAWPVDKAKEYLREQAGRQFDPAIVEAFLAMLAHPPSFGYVKALILKVCQVFA